MGKVIHQLKAVNEMNHVKGFPQYLEWVLNKWYMLLYYYYYYYHHCYYHSLLPSHVWAIENKVMNDQSPALKTSNARKRKKKNLSRVRGFMEEMGINYKLLAGLEEMERRGRFKMIVLYGKRRWWRRRIKTEGKNLEAGEGTAEMKGNSQLHILLPHCLSLRVVPC